MNKTAPSKAKETSRLTLTGRMIGRLIAATSLPEIMLVATLNMARYIQNSDFSYPSEMVLPIVLFAAAVTVIYYIYRLLLRDKLAAHVAALLLSYALYSYSYSFGRLHKIGNAVIPDSATIFSHALLQALILALAFGIIGLLLRLALHQSKQLQALPLLKFLVFVVAFIFAVQVGKVGLRIWDIRKELAYRQPVTSSLQAAAPKTKTTAAKPNVYYLLYDRYANPTVLQNIYNYDNSKLLNNLQAQGFYIRDSAYANYPFTMQSVSSTLKGGYHTELRQQFQNDATGFQTGFPYRRILDNSPVTQAFQKAGYQYNQVSSWWDFTRNNPSADTNPSKSFRLRIFGKNFWLTDLQRDIVNKSILSPFLLKGVTLGHTTLVQYQLDRNPTQNFYAQMEALDKIADNARSESKPQFTFAHILSPHDPYIFDAQGNTPTYDNNRTDNGVDERVKYTNQVTYLNTQITKLVSTIRSKDPSAAIVIQADEGPYPKQFRGELKPGHYYDPINLPLAQQRQKFGVMAAYYVPGVDQSTAAQNMTASDNTFRFIMNQYLGYSLPMLPDCQYTAGDKYNVFNFKLVTGQLKGQSAPAACSALR